MDLFPELEEESNRLPQAPLADRMRPAGWQELFGHDHLVGETSPLRRLIEKDTGLSFILWGPPGCGKTTIARIVARVTQSQFFEISAVNAGVKDIREVIETAQKLWKSQKRRTILFIDEIHRFNKAQQDAVLPYVENGTIRMIGSTTENPSFEVIPSLRSRCQVFRLGYLSAEDVRGILERALKDQDHGLGRYPVAFDEEALHLIISHANGDARRALNVLDSAVGFHLQQDPEAATPVDRAMIEGIIQRCAVLYDKDGTEHYDHASAFQKSLRGSDADAAIYWLAKMIAGGEDPTFIARRLVITAAEDIGNADPMALVVANAAADAVERIGLPEARIPLAQAVIYVARARKDNTAIRAIDGALSDIENKGLSYPVPDHLKDAHYRDAKKYGYGVEYKYPHDYPGGHVDQEYLPQELRGKKYLPDDKQSES
ncbi:replication-associated recombination protein A [Nitrospina watsonii]|uniref:Replication-associated recombination protein A n=1 Tax=Nitrospina watsonii TaxID=1323948 RepID=A0ABN8W370_9BACT|nr:replication-associated recombination protein A [Nitrospina watsonii]CAI2718513.1 AAA domain-containing protein [Nitrospina watsonii]